jgi:hypothetical protein
MQGQTIITNHPNRLYVVDTWHKPLMILLSGRIPLETHQSGYAIGSNGGLQIFYLKCF